MGNTITLSGVDFISNDGTWTVEGPAYTTESFGCIYTAIEGYVAAVRADKTLTLDGELYYLAEGEYEFDFNSAVEAALSEGLHAVANELIRAMIDLGVEVVGRCEVDEDGPDYYQARAATWNAMV